MKKAVLCLVFLTGMAWAQETFPVNDVRDERAHAYAFTNATIISDYQTTHESATLLIRDGVVESVGKNITVPDGYTVVDLKGRFIYPSLIDMYTSYGMPDPPKRERRRFGGPEQIAPKTEGAYNANDAIKAHINAAEVFRYKEKEAQALRKLGFGAVLTQHSDGLARGSSALVTLAKDSDNKLMLSSRAAAHYSFSKGTSRQNYPSSPMGFIALLRQTQMDAEWYAAQDPKPFTDQTLDAWLDLQDLPQIFETRDWRSLLRADKLGDSFQKQYIIKSGGDGYQRLDAIKATGASLIVPLTFPEAYDVSDPLDARRLTLAQLKHWEMAPANAAALDGKGINFALTTHGLGKKMGKAFWGNLRKAIKHGLGEEAALRALTHTPAQLLGMGDRLGKLAPGAVANFLITSGKIFDEKTEIHENWIQGQRYRFTDPHQPDQSGKYKLTMGDKSFDLIVSGKPGKHSMKIAGKAGEEKAKEGDDKPAKPKDIKVDGKLEASWVKLSFEAEPKAGAVRLSGWVEGKNWSGHGVMPDGSEVTWQAQYTGPADDDKAEDGKKKKDRKDKKGKKGKRGKKGEEDKADPQIGSTIFPFSAYGAEQIPTAEDILITGATVWTNEADGIMEGADVLIKDGKIAAVGKGLKARGARVVDGTGKHLTPGIIDEHSHIALDGVNDTATNSGMVRISDVVDSEDINIYRNLAGGVVAAQLLHGSANPIGGQSALVKYRWGHTPDDMLIEDADGFIKFALGENVKRSRSRESIRYPLSRMGVEQVYMDAFSNALDYEKSWKAYEGLSDADKAATTAPRRDLAQETMLEIIRGERFITCHSYVQSEINMLMKVAEHFGFRVNTFTHILEGYKVADIMAEHGVGGSTFSDWWAYKWEVRYAIPYNATLMNDAGVVVAINSDSAEMSRRLNQEAAKAVKYGGMSEEDALKLVTLNPAKLLHLDDRMGSVKVGKDADLVLWNNNPLSIYAKPEMTMVDGVVYFSLERDEAMREQIAAERARIIKTMKGKKGTKRPGGGKPLMHCDTLFEATEDHHEIH